MFFSCWIFLMIVYRLVNVQLPEDHVVVLLAILLRFYHRKSMTCFAAIFYELMTEPIIYIYILKLHSEHVFITIFYFSWEDVYRLLHAIRLHTRWYGFYLFDVWFLSSSIFFITWELLNSCCRCTGISFGWTIFSLMP